jgi:putative restriction endonuclease
MVPNAREHGAYPAAMDAAGDLGVRLAAFEWLREQVELHGDVIRRTLLEQGFVFEGQRVPLLGPQGIFKPRMCELPLSITTTPNSPYRDAEAGRYLVSYAYRGTDPEFADNRGLRLAMERGLPLVYFYGALPGRYIATWPVYVVGDDRDGLHFKISVGEASRLMELAGSTLPRASEERDDIRREYVTATVRHRLHQRAFREQVLDAYRVQCAICHLRHQELLDAAHIVEDSEDEGDPVVSNGLALCKLHHAAFDSFFLAVRPDYKIEVRRSILEESDGPMLLVGLKQAHDQTIQLPRSSGDRPDPARLQSRYERFLRAS